VNDLRILADDLTGALDSAAAFDGEVPVQLDVPPAQGPTAEAVSVVATATRDVALESLPRLLAPAVGWLAGGGMAFKKVDSLLRGNTFAEVAYVARAGGFRRVVFAPAFPKQGRFTIAGRQCVVPPGRSLDERQPVGAGAPADAFAVLGLPVATTPDARPDGLAVWIPDIRGEGDLLRIAARSQEPDAQGALWCGSAGLAQALAVTHRMGADTERVAFPELATGPVLLISASHHAVLREQWKVLRAAETGAIVVVHSQRAAIRSAFRAMGQRFDFAMFDLAPTRLLLPADAAALLAGQLDAIVNQSPHPAALVVVGGDTLRGVCRAAGARALVARASVRAGWGSARLVGGRWDGVHCFSRSGAFGDADDLSTMVKLVTQRTATAKETA